MIMESLEERIIRHEGFRSLPYLDILGNPTIGFGHCFPSDCADKYKDGITVEHATQLLEQDIANTKQNAALEFPWVLGLDDCRASVIYEMCFQLGVGGVTIFHKMIAAIRDHNWPEAAKQMLDSVWHEQTPARCEELAELMLNAEST